MIGEVDVVATLKNKRISRAERIQRARDQTIRKVTEWILNGMRPQGRPKMGKQN